MAEYAIRIFSPTEGFLKEQINAIDIKSREDARKVGPFCNKDGELIYWVNWGKRETGKKIKPYFRSYSDCERAFIKIKNRIDGEEKEILKIKKRDIHKKFQDTLCRALEQLIEKEYPIKWYFTDDRVSDFLLSGNLLTDVLTVEKEYRINLPFVNYYNLDIVLLGEKIKNKKIIFGAIEIEYTHEVDLLKTLLCKSLGFPLFTIKINESEFDNIDEEWCINRLIETKYGSEDGRRRNYIYIHNMLYPVYLSNYEEWGLGDNHQYIIFAKNKEIEKLKKYIDQLKSSLFLIDKQVKLLLTNRKPSDKSSVKMFENEGALVGENWKDYNSETFVRLILERPTKKSGNIYKFHLVLAQLLTLHIDCLVGYKYEIGSSNFDRNPIWYVKRCEPNKNGPPNYIWYQKRFCQKRLSEPIREIMKYIPKQL